MALLAMDDLCVEIRPGPYESDTDSLLLGYRFLWKGKSVFNAEVIDRPASKASNGSADAFYFYENEEGIFVDFLKRLLALQTDETVSWEEPGGDLIVDGTWLAPKGPIHLRFYIDAGNFMDAHDQYEAGVVFNLKTNPDALRAFAVELEKEHLAYVDTLKLPDEEDEVWRPMVPWPD